MTVQALAPRDVQSTLNYYTPLDSQPPYYYVDDSPEGVPKTNVGQGTHPVVIHDARGKGDTLGLDVSGFQFVHYPSAEKDFADEDKIKSAYYAEVEDILKKCIGAKRVFIFDHTIRRSPAAQTTPSKAPLRGPVHSVHADQTAAAAAQRVELHLGDEAERLLKGRYRIINVWRSVAGVHLIKYSLRPNLDLLPTPWPTNPLPWLTIAPSIPIMTSSQSATSILIVRDSTFSVKYNPGHKWYYLSDQTPDEVTFIKCFDSDVDKARLTPHSAFHDSTSPPDAPQRQSIEVRALVFDTE
ncbi:hypothetical protein JVT61DRAFT_1114 [Boletus reticuloceps]|uniref:Methyltransferase n=1 Tax=Boletus reticuloceps TaxID=495285 RepID=A0A8I2YPW7_9AGAM|nr:hypothetical protein JVT61DRAFT_1114 [Boletus reticuloceps]